MARKIVEEHTPAPAKPGGTEVNELLVCQAKALMRKLWPEEFDVKPDLKLVADEPQPPRPTGNDDAREERGCLLRIRIREIKGWTQREEYKQDKATLARLAKYGSKPTLRLIQGGRKS